MMTHERTEVIHVKYVFMFTEGKNVPELVRTFGEIRLIPLDEDEPILLLVNKENVEEVNPQAHYLVLISAEGLTKLKRREQSKVVVETATKVEEKKEVGQPKKSLIDIIYEKVKWMLSENADKLPFVVIDIVKEKDEEFNLWTLKFRLEKKGVIAASLYGAAKLIVENLLKIMNEEKYPEPLMVVISMEGKVLYVIADVVLDEVIKAILASKGLIIKDYMIVFDVANDMITVTILAEKSPDAKVGIFSGYKIAEEVGKVVKERLKTKKRVKVHLKVGLFDYAKIL